MIQPELSYSLSATSVASGEHSESIQPRCQSEKNKKIIV